MGLMVSLNDVFGCYLKVGMQDGCSAEQLSQMADQGEILLVL